MNQQDYNAKVQELQDMWLEKSRIEPYHDTTGRMISAAFQVYWDGRWQTLGTQHNPFTAGVRYTWNEYLELKLRGAFAGALIHS